ncbi:unnamed protein product, partial [Hymenolepis diminuta]
DVSNCQPYCDLGCPSINVVCPQVAHPHRSKKLTKFTSDDSCRGTADLAILGTSPVNTIPSLSYNLPAQLKYTYNYVLTRVLIQVTNVIILSTYTERRHVSDTSSFASFFPQFSLLLGSLYYS